MKNNIEQERIKRAYEKRKGTAASSRYSFFDEANLFIIQGRERELLRFFNKHEITSLKGKKILDIGCGSGGELMNLIRYGAQPENLYGIDLLSERIDTAKSKHPTVCFECGDASTLVFNDKTFDMILQFTVFTSILDSDMKKSIAQEMLRVLKDDGIIVWYDFLFRNPSNRDVRPVKKSEIVGLFPYCCIDLKKITLAPPLVRRLARYSTLLCLLTEKVKIFNTHYLGVIKKKGSSHG